MDNLLVFKEPVSIRFEYDSANDIIVFKYLTRITDENGGGLINNTDPDMSSSRLWSYNMLDKSFYFEHSRINSTNISVIRTTIFSGKLFLMLKYYVCKIYIYLPKIFTPDWFQLLEADYKSG